MKSFLNELRQRRVYRVALGYAVAAWLCIQVGATVLPAFHAPEIVLPILIVLLAIGFPIALVLAWAFDVTPSGIERAPEDGGAGRAWNSQQGWLLGLAGLAIALLFVGSYWTWRSRPAPGRSQTTSGPASSRIASTPDNSIAVLPFVDLSQAKDQEYLCDGMSEELLDALSKIGALHVVARTSSFFFKGKNENVGEIARKLNVSKILEGSIRRDGNRIRVTTQLINASDGFHLWSETYERELGGVFALQDEITRAIVEALKIKLAVVTPPRAEPNVEAHDLYLQGLYFSNKTSEADLRRALSFFQMALDRDPNFARAWSGIAKTWSWLADEYVKPLEAYPISRAAALKAIALDEQDAEAHVYLGAAEGVLEWNWNAQNAEARRALEIDPNSASAHITLAMSLSSNGSDEEAFAEMEAAKRLDPLSIWVSFGAAIVYLSSDRFDDAVAEGQRMMALDPNYSYFDETLGIAYRERGQLNEAIALYEKAQSVTQVPRAGLAITYVRAGRVEDARRVLAQLLERSKTRYVEADAIASIYVALGEKEEAFRWLERAVAEHSTPLQGLGRRIVFRPLHSDPRFADLLRRVGIDPAKVLSLK